MDRSIDSPAAFLETNVRGTFVLLEEARRYWRGLAAARPEKAADFRFLHISTDEVFGDLADASAGPGAQAPLFSESTPYAPSSPYSASKAASDHLVRAWQRTYGLPTLITNCSNNYGPRQFPILPALAGRKLPVYGTGAQIRDWLHVEDHVRALLLVLARGRVGETYAVGGSNEQRNIDVVRAICGHLETLAPRKPAGVRRYEDLITLVADRPGHDGRYAIVAGRTGPAAPVRWYLDNETWWRQVLDGTYRCERLGTGDRMEDI